MSDPGAILAVGDIVLDAHYGACVVEHGPGYGGALTVRVLASGRTLRQHQSWFKPAPDAITALGWLRPADAKAG